MLEGGVGEGISKMSCREIVGLSTFGLCPFDGGDLYINGTP